MARTLENEHLNAFVENPDIILGLSGLISTRIANIYADYLMKKFDVIDKQLNTKSLRDRNVGKKGEYLLCGIIDLTMWRFRYSIYNDYKIKNEYMPDKVNKQGALDFRLNLNNNIFLCEAKNWSTTIVNYETYKEKIKKRFRFKGINVLSINKHKVKDVLKYSKNIHIDFISLPKFMDFKKNIFDDIRDNIFCGVYQLTEIIENYTSDIRKSMNFTLDDCLKLGMPTWFISDYCGKAVKTIYRHSKNLKLNRKSKQYHKITGYRRIKIK